MATTTATKPKKAETTDNAEKPTPVHKAKYGALQIAVWENQRTDNEGNTRIAHTFTLQRNYLDKHGKWQETSMSLGEKDFGHVQALMANAQQYLVKEG